VSFATLTSIILIILAFFFFLKNLKKSKWLQLQNNYPMPAKVLNKINSQLNYDPANVNGVHYKNSVFSLINEQGILIRKPFPFSLILRPLLIPWADIKEIKIINSITDETNLLSKTMNRLSLNNYVKINLLGFKNFFIIIKWKNEYNKKGSN